MFRIALAVTALAGAAVLAQPAPPKGQRAAWHSSAGYLGIGVLDIDAERAKALNLKEEYGVEVKSVAPESPAAKAGFKEGDVVLEYNGQRVEGLEQFMRMVRETPAGRKVNVTVWRNGAAQSLSAVLTSRPAPAFGVFGPGEIEMPALPSMPAGSMVRLPDLPHPVMSWQSSVLGIESEPLNTQLAEFFGVKAGVLVRSVNQGSAAEKAGIKAGDVIVKVENDTVASPRELSGALRSRQLQKSVQLTVVRNRKEVSVSVRLSDVSRGLLGTPGAKV